MVEEFTEGKWYKCSLKERPRNWNDDGLMDFMLTGEPFQCKRGMGKTASFYNDYNGEKEWYWGSGIESFTEVSEEDIKKEKVEIIQEEEFKKESIMENIGDMMGFPLRSDTAKRILDFESKMKVIGIERIAIREYVKEEEISEEIKMIIHPRFTDAIYGDTKRIRLEEEAPLLERELISLAGFRRDDSMRRLEEDAFRNTEEITAEAKEERYRIGDYLKERNVILIYLPFSINNITREDEEEYTKELIRIIKESIKRIRIERVDIKEKMKEMTISNYIKGMKNRRKTIQREIRGNRENISDYERTISSAIRRIKELREEEDSIKMSAKGITKRLTSELDRIEELKFVKNLEIANDGIRMEFPKIYIRVDGEDIYMGEYKITLKPSHLIIKNKDPIEWQGEMYHHCHITDSSICYGEKGSKMVREMLGRMELKKIVNFIYLYLKSYNPDDTHISMENWIKGRENGDVVPEGDDGGSMYCEECGEDVEEEDYNYEEEMCNDCWNS